MGQSSSKTYGDNLLWNMTSAPSNIEFSVPYNVKSMNITIPIQGQKDKIIKIKGNSIKINELYNKIHKIYKPYKNKIDHVFFQGLDLIEIKNNIAYLKLNTGS
jgi:hypothetical protein